MPAILSSSELNNRELNGNSNKNQAQSAFADCASACQKNKALRSDKRAAGELEGARPASNRINRRRKPWYIKAFGNSILNAFKMLGGKRGQKSPVRTFLTSCTGRLEFCQAGLYKTRGKEHCGKRRSHLTLASLKYISQKSLTTIVKYAKITNCVGIAAPFCKNARKS